MSKKITIKNVLRATETGENEDVRLNMFEMEGGDDMDASDGYHTFDELYEHRITLFIALARKITHMVTGLSSAVWRSKLHSDGSEYEGWFILGIGKSKGDQITYHLPIEKWDETNFAETLGMAPSWDGHTPVDVLERLKSL